MHKTIPRLILAHWTSEIREREEKRREGEREKELRKRVREESERVKSRCS